jgi:hypothetical protein
MRVNADTRYTLDSTNAMKYSMSNSTNDDGTSGNNICH